MSVYNGTPDADELYSYVGDDELYGFEGNDLLGSAVAPEDLTGGDTDRDYMDGGAGNDTVSGGYHDDTLLGGAGNDLLDGGVDTTLEYFLGYDEFFNPIYEYYYIAGGNDVLNGGTGADTMRGGHGDDWYRVDNAGDQIVELSDQGMDTVETSVSYTVSAHIEKLVLLGASNLSATGSSTNNTMIGNSGNNVLNGMAGSDRLEGKAGADTLKGGADNDEYILSDDLDTVVELEGEGIDTVYAEQSHSLADNVEHLRLMGTAAINGTGNALNNMLTGNVANNMLVGGAGSDTLDGGEGNDSMVGGQNDDLYLVDSPQDVITELANEGTDSVVASSSFTLGSNIEHLTLTGTMNINGTGNNLSNLIIGNYNNNLLRGGAGNDTLDGGDGTDKFYGGTGNDVFIIDKLNEQVYENANEGIDTVRTLISYTLSENVENLELTGVLNSAAFGNSLNNVLTGNEGANQLDGKTGADTMIGGLGDDWYTIDSAQDVLIEQEAQGVDSVESFVGYTLGANLDNLRLRGSAHINGAGNSLNNRLLGNDGNNVLTGGAGDDLFIYSAGNDTLNGGDGIDTVSYYGILSEMNINLQTGIAAGTSGPSDTLSGIENVIGSNFSDYIQGNISNNVFIGYAGDDTIYGGGGSDTISYATAVVQSVTVSLATLGDFEQELQAYGEGHDLLVGRDLLYGISNVIGSDTSDQITGSHGSNRISGGKGFDYLDGGIGYLIMTQYYDGYEYYDVEVYIPDADDWLEGGQGDDTIYGGDGMDTASYINATAAVQVDLAANSAKGGDGTDKLYYIESVEGSAYGDELVGNNVNNVLTGMAGNDELYGKAGNDTLAAGDGDDLLIGGDGNDSMDGGDGSDTLTGNAGNDTLNGGWGGDIMVGGTGDDVYQLDHSDDVAVESANQGIDLVRTSLSYTLGANLEKLELTGTAHVNGIGNAFNNSLAGNSGNNLLNGGAGVDTMAGGLGDDTYVIDSLSDVIVEFSSSGWDTVKANFSYTLTNPELEVIMLTGTANHNATGNNGRNWLYGNSGHNLLDGGGDTDIMFGGGGNDTYIVESIYDSAVEEVGQGADTVLSSVTYDSVGRDIENIILTGTANVGVIGNLLRNNITGNSGNNLLDGGTGIDTLTGGLGNDTYLVDNTADLVVETSTLATEIDVVHSMVGFALGANLENLVLTGTTAINGIGNSLANRLTGNSTGNKLDGGAGTDTLTGGLGNDTYVVDSTHDVVVETSTLATEIDVVHSMVGFTLGANLENLVLTGTAAIHGGGNSLANRLTGNGGGNRLNGGAGADTMVGGLGNDTYIVDVATDVVTEGGASLDEIDIVFSSVSYTLGANLENLVLTGSANLNGAGNNRNNMLTGNSGANVLTGGLGNDTYVIDHVGDMVVETSASATEIDLVQSRISYTLGATVENLSLTGTAAINGGGNSLANILTGNTAANLLDGGAGADALYGGGGADTLIGGTGNDLYVVDSSNDVVIETSTLATEADTVQSSASFVLGANVENLMLMGMGNINATGNSLANILTGNDGNNVLNGGAGADTLIGNLGNDTYSMRRGGGVDTLVENDASVGNNDLLSFAAGVTHDQLWFSHVGNHLEVSIIGTTDKMVVMNWYSGTAQHVEQITTVDGTKMLLDSNVENLVTAMASMTPPPLGQTSLTAAEHAQLDAVIAANWS